MDMKSINKVKKALGAESSTVAEIGASPFVYQPVVLNNKQGDQQMNLHRGLIKRLFHALMRKGRLTWNRIYTAVNVRETGLQPVEYIDRKSKAYDIDYERLRESVRTRYWN